MKELKFELRVIEVEGKRYVNLVDLLDIVGFGDVPPKPKREATDVASFGDVGPHK